MKTEFSIADGIHDLIGDNGVFIDGDWIESKDQDPNGDVRLIQLADIGDSTYVNKSNRFLTRQKATQLGCTFLESGDVLIARMPDPLGRACLFPGDKKSAVTVVDVCIVRSKDEYFANKWLMHFINAPAFREDIHKLQSGSTRKRISRGNLATLRLPVPPRNEQTRIVAKLEELLSDLDAGVAELKAAQKKLGQYRQSLLKAAVEGKLTESWRVANLPAKTLTPQPPLPEVEGGQELVSLSPSTSGRGVGVRVFMDGAGLLVRILVERRRRWEEKQLAKFKEQGKAPPKDWQKKYPEPVKPDTSGLPELPEGWVWANIEQLGYVQLGRQRSPAKMKGESPVKYIRAANITEAGINFGDVLEMDFSANEQATFQLETGDVLLTEASGSPEHVGRPVVWPEVEGLYCFQNTVIRFRPIFTDSHFSFRLFQAWQKLGKFIQVAGGVGINHLSAGKFASIIVPLPPLQEQQAIVELLASALNEVQVQEHNIAFSLKQAAAQRKNILKAAFAGQLVPQDPEDEPASVLLERIRAERDSLDTDGASNRRKRKSHA